jgi:hypothetical protein
MDQEAGHQPLTTETWVNFHASQCRLCGGQSGRFSPAALPVSPVNILPMLHTCISYNYHQFYTILANDNAVKQNTSCCLSLDLCCYFVLELYKL